VDLGAQVEKQKKTEKPSEDSGDGAKDAQPEKKPAERDAEKSDKQKKKQQRVPEPARWSRVTPVQSAGGDGPIDEGDEPIERPEPAPELDARHLPAVPRSAEPPTAPDRVSLKSGHLTLPPPLS
jgi:hypothetical protein